MRSECKVSDKRRSDSIDLEAITAIYKTLKGVKVTLERDPSTQSLRAQFSDIRVMRNKVTKILITLKARLAGIRGDLIRVERVIENDTAHMMATNDGLLGTKNVEQRKARIKLDLDEWYDARAVLRDDVQMIEEVVSTVMIVREELRYAYEEASRAQSSLELEFKMVSSAP